MKWWKPIETGGSLLCKECPEFLRQRDEAYAYAGTVRALEEEVYLLRQLAASIIYGAECQIDDLGGLAGKPVNKHWSAAWRAFDDLMKKVRND